MGPLESDAALAGLLLDAAGCLGPLTAALSDCVVGYGDAERGERSAGEFGSLPDELDNAGTLTSDLVRSVPIPLEGWDMSVCCMRFRLRC
jgi:hypothetical protein